MRAMLLHQYGDVEHLRWGDLPLPEPGPDDVRIRIEAIALNPVDCHMRKGGDPGPLPLVLGLDAAGHVDAVGANVRRFRRGDGVLAVLLGPHSNGAYAQAACTHEAFVSLLPRRQEPLRGVTLGLAALTAWEAVMLRARVQPGQAVFVAGGAGGVGSFAISLARGLGADPVLATAGSEASAAYLTGVLGLPEGAILRYVGLSLEEQVRWVRERTGGQGVAAAFDFVGGDMKRLCLQVLDFHGCVVSSVPERGPGLPLDLERALDARSASYHSLALSAPARLGAARDWAVYRAMFAGLVERVEAGTLALPPVREMGVLDERTIRAAHRMLETGHMQGKLVLRVR